MIVFVIWWWEPARNPYEETSRTTLYYETDPTKYDVLARAYAKDVQSDVFVDEVMIPGKADDGRTILTVQKPD